MHYLVVQGDSPRSIDNALTTLVEAEVFAEEEVPALKQALTFGPTYNRAVRDNVDRALWAYVQHNNGEGARHWADIVRKIQEAANG